MKTNVQQYARLYLVRTTYYHGTSKRITFGLTEPYVEITLTFHEKKIGSDHGTGTTHEYQGMTFNSDIYTPVYMRRITENECPAVISVFAIKVLKPKFTQKIPPKELN